jgi:hypothetical protein
MFLGALMIADGIYEQRLQACKRKTRIEYKFIPRTHYEDQMRNDDFTVKMQTMFAKDQPWRWRDTVDVTRPDTFDRVQSARPLERM